MLRSNHYDLAFSEYLQKLQVGYIAVDEHRRAQLADESLKSLDFIVSVPGKKHLLIDIKGRKTSLTNSPRPRRFASSISLSKASGYDESDQAQHNYYKVDNHFLNLPAENWVTTDDLHGLTLWQQQFGQDFQSLLVFSHIIPTDQYFNQHQASLELSTVTYKSSLYLFTGIRVKDYTLHMDQRSKKWTTWWLKHQDYRRLAQPIINFLS